MFAASMSSCPVEARCLGDWTAAERLSRPGMTVNLQPQVAVDGAGWVTAAWAEMDENLTERILVARRAPGGGWQPAQELARTHSQEPFPSEIDLAVGAAGHALVTWRRQVKPGFARPWVAAFDPATGWGAPVDLRQDGELWMHRASVAVNASGQGVVSWRSDPTLYVRLYQPGLGWSAAHTVPAGGGWAPPETRVAINAAGQAAVAWEALQPKVLRRDPATGWQPTEVLLATGRVDGARVPELAMTPDGDIFVAWSHLTAPRATVQVHVAHYRSGVGWGPTLAVSDLLAHSLEADVAVNARGEAGVVWNRGNRLQAIAYAPGTGWSVPSRITPRRDPAGTYTAPLLHLSDEGLATASTWWWPGVPGEPGMAESFAARLDNPAERQWTRHERVGSNIDAGGAANGMLAVSGVVRGGDPAAAGFSVRVREPRCAAGRGAS